MRSFFTIIIVLLACDVAFTQRSGEEITYIREKGIYMIRYWSNVNNAYYEVPLFPGNECKPIVMAYTSDDPDSNQLLYRYILSNSKNAVRELYTFFVNIPATISEVKKPNEEWTGKHLKWMKGVIWRQTNSASNTLGILPGEKVDGEFGFLAVDLPGVVNAHASSYWNLGNTRDEGPSGEMRVKVDSLLETTKYVSFKTIGPRKLPKNVTDRALLDSLQSYLAFSCDTSWIENQGICRSLETKLENVERQLQRSNTKTAANNVQAFLNEVQALREKQLSSEAYALLYYNGQYLLDKLTKQ